MNYKVVFTERAKKQLKKLDRQIASLIIGWIEKNLENCDNPRLHGKSLVGNKSGQWRYRVGDYRLICEIQDEQITILVLEVGHRRSIYEDKRLAYYKLGNHPQFIFQPFSSHTHIS